jgi:hypothetical protein
VVGAPHLPETGGQHPSATEHIVCPTCRTCTRINITIIVVIILTKNTAKNLITMHQGIFITTNTNKNKNKSQLVVMGTGEDKKKNEGECPRRKGRAHSCSGAHLLVCQPWERLSR